MSAKSLNSWFEWQMPHSPAIMRLTTLARVTRTCRELEGSHRALWADSVRSAGQCGGGSHQSMADGIGDSGGAGVNIQLDADMLDVGRRGPGTYKQRFSY